MIPDEKLALAFKALAHPRRARLYRLLSEQPEQGRSFMALQRATGLCKTSLHHHLVLMERCGVLKRVRKGPRVAHVMTTGALAAAMSEVARLRTAAQRPLAHAA